MGVVVGLGVGLGLLLVYSAFAFPRSVRPPRGGRIQRLLSQAGMSGIGPAPFVAVCVVTGLVAALVVLAATRAVPVALVFGLMAGWSPVSFAASRARRRRREYAAVWPDVLDDLASAVRAGLSLPEALAGLAVRGPGPLREPFAAFALDFQVGGRFGPALDLLKERLADPVGDRVVEGLRVAREVGGGELGRLLRALSAHLREDARTRGELEARQAWVVNGARVAVAAPWLVLGFMALQPDVIGRYAGPGGAVVLTVGAILCIVAYRLMLRIGRLPDERRVLS
jgi:tight adherence protein B